MESVYSDMSESEKEVAAYLKELGLYWIFESPIFVSMKKADHASGHPTSTCPN